jgi:hypothetical protein
MIAKARTIKNKEAKNSATRERDNSISPECQFRAYKKEKTNRKKLIVN